MYFRVILLSISSPTSDNTIMLVRSERQSEMSVSFQMSQPPRPMPGIGAPPGKTCSERIGPPEGRTGSPGSGGQDAEGGNPAEFGTKHFVSNFKSLAKISIPMVLTLVGTVHKFGSSGNAANEKEVQSVFVQDDNGDLLKVVFHDRWASGVHLQVGSRLQVFFAKALGGRGDRKKEVTVRGYNDAFVNVSQTNVALKTVGVEVKIEA